MTGAGGPVSAGSVTSQARQSLPPDVPMQGQSEVFNPFLTAPIPSSGPDNLGRSVFDGTLRRLSMDDEFTSVGGSGGRRQLSPFGA